MFRQMGFHGSPLTSTLVDFCASHIENSVGYQSILQSRTLFRYLEDTFVVFKHLGDAKLFIDELQNLSILNFAFDKSESNSFYFLDVNVLFDPSATLTTDKSTDKGFYTNFYSQILNFQICGFKNVAG